MLLTSTIVLFCFILILFICYIFFIVLKFLLYIFYKYSYTNVICRYYPAVTPSDIIRRCCIKIIGGLICLPNRFGDLTIPVIHNKSASTVWQINVYLISVFSNIYLAFTKNTCRNSFLQRRMLNLFVPIHYSTNPLYPDPPTPLPPIAYRPLVRKEPIQRRAPFMVYPNFPARDRRGRPWRGRLASFAGGIYGGRRRSDRCEYLWEHLAE
jgi:hypothetical protein